MLTATANLTTRPTPATRSSRYLAPRQEWAVGQAEVTRVDRTSAPTASNRPGFLMALLRAFSAFGA